VAILRTPDDRFADLPGYPFAPHYAEVVAKGVEPLRMHYVYEGPGADEEPGVDAASGADAPVVVLLHGQPTWSYLYRSVIARLAAAGLRVIAPDLIGYGRSDKPTDPTDYTFRRHVAWIESFLVGLDLHDVTLVVQDWGGPIGLSALARIPDRFARIVAANTILHTADPALAGRLAWAVHGIDGDRVVIQEALVDYLLHYQRVPRIVPSGYVDAVAGPLPEAVKAAYDAPYPDPSYTAGLRQLTALLPLTRNDPGAAIGRATMAALREWRKPFLTAYSDGDPPTRGWDRVFHTEVPGAAGMPHVTIEGAGHFLQETHGDLLADVIAGFVRST
jgi:haloalkane dehalogenase